MEQQGVLYWRLDQQCASPNASPPRNCITSGRLSFLFLTDHLYLRGHAFPTSSHADTVSDSAVVSTKAMHTVHIGIFTN